MYRRQSTLVVIVLVALLGVGAVLMNSASYEVWGGVLAIPVLAIISLPALRWVLRKDLGHLFNVLALGFALKMLGTILRFYVFAKVYGSVADSTYYYNKGSIIAAAVRSGERSLWSALPLERELGFVIRLTGTVLTFTGPTRLGAFLVFGTFGYWGAVFLVVAACRAVPGLAQRRYALLCCLTPTLVFWPSSLGKEAWILLCIGVFSLGVARILNWDHPGFGLLLAVLAGTGIGAVRIHLAVVFVAGAAVAFVQGIVLQPGGSGARRRGGPVFFAVVSVAVMGVLSYVAARHLKLGDSNGDFLSNLDSALDRAAAMSETGGSSFTPISTRNPLNWPWAIFRTLTRPLPFDVSSAASLLPALETSLFLVAVVIGYRRLQALRVTARNAPYVTYCLVTALLFGLVFSSFGNLGILVRQRSLVAAFIVLVLCLPKAPSRAERYAKRWDPESAQRVGAAASRA